MAISMHRPNPDARAKAKDDALVNYVAFFKLAHESMPRPQTLARIGQSLGMNVANPERILKDAEQLAEQMKGTAVERAAKNGDFATATSLQMREKALASAKEAQSRQSDLAPAPRKRQQSFDPLLVIAYPLMLINGLCAFLLMGAFNVCIAIAKTFKGETVE